MNSLFSNLQVICVVGDRIEICSWERGAKALMNDLFSMSGEVPIGRWKMIPM